MLQLVFVKHQFDITLWVGLYQEYDMLGVENQLAAVPGSMLTGDANQVPRCSKQESKTE